MGGDGRVTTLDDPVVTQMQYMIEQWQQAGDARAVFLDCYLLMTRNMLAAIHAQEFHDCAWVNRLLDHFAGYYFKALDVYEQDPRSAPRVWQIAHHTAHDESKAALQKLLVGVNAHINYDLVLAVVDMLDAEWSVLSADARVQRYTDYCHVNAIIAQTIDAVQDQVLHPLMPGMLLIDHLMGNLDEKMISSLIIRWRDIVWQHVTLILAMPRADERAHLVRQVEDHALGIANLICLKGLPVSISDVI
jgi:hypothetical protein